MPAVKAKPTVPESVWFGVMIGVPASMVNPTLSEAPLPAPFDAAMLAVNEPVVVGAPVMAPVVELIESPAGRPVAAHAVAGRSRASSSERFAENASPTLPVNVCPAVMSGTPMAIEIVAVSVSEPPGPVAVREIVVVSTSCGVPVISPVLELSDAQLGSPSALHDVTGRFVESVSENVLKNAAPTFPEPVCPGEIKGCPAEMEISAVSVSEPAEFVAVMVTVTEPTVVGVPVISPVEALSNSPSGSPVAAHEVAGRLVGSVSENVLENATPTLPEALWSVTIIGTPAVIEMVALVGSLVSPVMELSK